MGHGRQLMLIFAICVLGQLVHAEYEFKLLLVRFDNGQGFLANASHCDPMWYTDVHCSISINLCVEMNSNKPNEDLTDCATYPDGVYQLTDITTNANKIDFEKGKQYGSGTPPVDNPIVITVADTADVQVYTGFQIKLKAFHGGDEANLIDEYLYVVDPNGKQVHASFDYSHFRKPAPESTIFSAAFLVSGDTAVPTTTTTTPVPMSTVTEEDQATTTKEVEQPTAAETVEPPASGATELSVTTTTTLGTPGTTPFQAVDCDDFTDTGVKTIYIGGKPVEVYCERLKQNSLTVIQSRGETDTTSMNVTYDTYKQPIGKAGKATNFWLGLENMYNLIQSRSANYYGLVIQLCCGETPATTLAYTNLALGDSSTNYKLSATATTTTGLNFQNIVTDLDSPFSTVTEWHQSEDDCPEEICEVVTDVNGDPQGEGGWWFGSCTNNLNGHYYDPVKNPGEFDNAAKCVLKDAITKPTGTGIEMNTMDPATPVDPNFTQMDSISYTRVRMAIYNTNFALPVDVDMPNFCKD